jgi:hypothetical protein
MPARKNKSVCLFHTAYEGIVTNASTGQHGLVGYYSVGSKEGNHISLYDIYLHTLALLSIPITALFSKYHIVSLYTTHLCEIYVK